MISDFMQTLLDRMDKFPEEFVDPHADLTDYNYRRAMENTRWGGIAQTMFYSGGGEYHFDVFTEAERAAYFSKIRGILRKKLEQDICSALVSDQRQMELPFDVPNIPTSILKTA
jgi:hypothetical protein